VKNHELAVIQSAANPLKTVPPRFGCAQLGESSLVKISILVTNAPRKTDTEKDSERSDQVCQGEQRAAVGHSLSFYLPGLRLTTSTL
jgi:hypothetical protein